MKLTVAYALLAQCFGINDVTGSPGVPASDKASILTAMNAANQEVLEKGHVDQKRVVKSAALFGPADLAGIGVTQGSTTITGTVAAQWIGCTVLLPGEEEMPNEFVSATALLNPTLLATGTVIAKVYGDSVLCSEDTDHVTGSVTINGSNPVVKLDTYEDFRQLNTRGRLGRPTHYWVQPGSANSDQILRSRIRVTPRPDRPYLLNYEIAKRAIRYIDTDLVDANKVIMVAGDMAETIWLPIAKYKLKDSPHFDDALTAAVDKGYAAALATLSGKSLSTASTGTRTVPHGVPPTKR